jgi:hypothetical protein
MLAVVVDALVHRAVEIVLRPFADTGVRIGRDVGGKDRSERRRDRAAAGEGLAPVGGVTGGTIAGRDQVMAALRLRKRSALRQCEAGDGKQHQAARGRQRRSNVPFAHDPLLHA